MRTLTSKVAIWICFASIFFTMNAYAGSNPFIQLANAFSSTAGLVESGEQAASDLIGATGERLSRDIQGKESVNLGTLDADMNVTIEGDIRAEEHSTVGAGGLTMSNIDVGELIFKTDISVRDVTAEEDSEAFVGAADLRNLSAGLLDIYSFVRANGDITAEDGSSINVGSVKAY